MSRRIAVFALVAGTALIAAPVSADQECFDSTCLAPEVSAAPPELVPAPAEAAQPMDEIIQASPEVVHNSDEAPQPSAKAESETFKAPDAIAKDVIVTLPPSFTNDEMAKQIEKEKQMAKELAKMPVVETPPAVVARKAPPAPRIYPKSAPEPAVRHPEPQQRVADEPVTPVQATAEVPVRVVGARRGREVMTVPVEPAPQAPVRQVHNTARPGAAYARRVAPNVVVVAPPVAEDGTIVYPAVRPDPNWRLCQIDPRTGQQYYCTAQSYHPYGEGGYRPMGTYRPYRGYPTAPGYVTTQPDARIISLDQGD